jgi:hypothetical protein
VHEINKKRHPPSNPPLKPWLLFLHNSRQHFLSLLSLFCRTAIPLSFHSLLRFLNLLLPISEAVISTTAIIITELFTGGAPIILLPHSLHSVIGFPFPDLFHLTYR